MKVGVGADQGGFEMKQQLAKLLRDAGYDVIDFGNKLCDRTMTTHILPFLWPAPWPGGARCFGLW